MADDDLIREVLELYLAETRWTTGPDAANARMNLDRIRDRRAAVERRLATYPSRS